MATIVFLPAISSGELFGRTVVGAIAPVGISVVVGAFTFGIGMQLGGGCASGTLFAVGGGSARVAVTLAGFIVGSIIATLHMPWWVSLPSLGSISLVRELGLAPAIVMQLAAFAAIAWASWVWQRRSLGVRHPLQKSQTPLTVRIVMNCGILLCALLAAALAGKFAPNFKIPPRVLCAAILGGLLLGYGARLAFGCNIGAFFSGVASGSLHGWLWLVCALAGNWAGVRLRPVFALHP